MADGSAPSNDAVPKLSFENGDESLQVREFSVRERIQSCFEATVVARSPSPDLDYNQFVNKAAGLAVATRFGGAGWTGVCRHMEMLQVEKTATGLNTYRLTIVPALWLLTQRRNNRIFQHKSVRKIVEEILGEYQIEAKWELKEDHPTYEYRVQYGESDFDFVKRLLERDGISFFFNQVTESETKGGWVRKKRTIVEVETELVFSDQPQKGAAIDPIYFYDQPNEGQRSRPFVSNVRLIHHVRPGKLHVRDYDFRRPLHKLEAINEASGSEAPYEHYVYEHGAALIDVDSAPDKKPVADDKSTARHDDNHLTWLATRQFESLRADKRQVELHSNQSRLYPGRVFSIDGHPRSELGEKLLVVESLLTSNLRDWNLAVNAVFAKEPYRPPHATPKPAMQGIQTAMVVGPPGQQIYTDEYGRIRVRFHWDRIGKFDDNATCWLRVSQGWAGTRFGMMLIPRVGQEVIVDFFEGDPDQPLVVGRLHNATTQVPRKLPKHKTQAIWRSATSPHTDGYFNEIMFEDEKMRELLFWQAQRDMLRLTKNDETERVGSDRIEVVGEGRVAAVARNDYLEVGNRRTVKMVKTGNLQIEEMGHPIVTEKETYIEVKHDKITLTTGRATIALDGANITVKAQKGIRFTANKNFILQGSMVYLNCKPVSFRSGYNSVSVSDPVKKPDRMLGSIEKLFWKPLKAKELDREDIKAKVEQPEYPPVSPADVPAGSGPASHTSAATAAVAHAQPNHVANG